LFRTCRCIYLRACDRELLALQLLQLLAVVFSLGLLRPVDPIVARGEVVEDLGKERKESGSPPNLLK